MTKYNWERINSDANGNPRYVVHFTEVCPDVYRNIPLAERYKATCKLMNKVGGRKYHNKSYGGGIVFQSYNLAEDEKHIDALIEQENRAFNNLPENRKYYKYERVLLDGDYSAEENGCKNDKEIAENIYKRFVNEYGHEIKRIGFNHALENWLAGLALNIPCYYADIIALAEAEDKPERRKDEICENYFNYMAMRLRGVWSYFDIN